MFGDLRHDASECDHRFIHFVRSIYILFEVTTFNRTFDQTSAAKLKSPRRRLIWNTQNLADYSETNVKLFTFMTELLLCRFRPEIHCFRRRYVQWQVHTGPKRAPLTPFSRGAHITPGG